LAHAQHAVFGDVLALIGIGLIWLEELIFCQEKVENHTGALRVWLLLTMLRAVQWSARVKKSVWRGA
jgi:hypothetical protein